MSTVASLGMYDHPAQHAANDRIWSGMAQVLRARGIAGVPARLDRGRAVDDVWHDPDLLFGQICGFPLIVDPTLSLRVLAQPVYAAAAGVADTHCSFVVARRSDAMLVLEAFRGRRAAINGYDSNSGMNLFRAAIATVAGGQPFFASVVETGSHRDSMLAIVRDDADIAAIDAVTFAALARFEPELTKALRIVALTPTSPTLPFVTSGASSDQTVQALLAALAHVLADPDLADARADLFLTGIAPAVVDRFTSIQQLASDAASAGYPELR